VTRARDAEGLAGEELEPTQVGRPGAEADVAVAGRRHGGRHQGRLLAVEEHPTAGAGNIEQIEDRL
jgi:hypothetical protein